MSALTQDPPKFSRIPAALNYGGIGRTKLYELAAQNPGLFVKCGAATLVNNAKYDEVLSALPIAKLTPPKKAASA
jgi:hypothetical protein